MGFSQSKTTRRGKLVCNCGSVEADLYLQSANYKYIEPPCFQCACTDCVGFVDKVLESGPSKNMIGNFCTPGSASFVLYDSEILVTKGNDNIKAVKLSKKSGNKRFYATCCGTPLGVSADSLPITTVYPNLINKTELVAGEVDFPPESISPSICLHAASAKKGRRAEPKEMKIVPGIFAPKFIGISCLCRMTLLAMIGKSGPGKGFPTVGEIGIGIESIKSK